MHPEHTQSTPLMRAAYDYINQNGWTILGVNADKKPAGPWGIGGWNRFDYTNAEQLFQHNFTAIAVVTGPSGLVGIDFDNDAAIIAWAERYGVPTTLIAETPRGKHLYYRAPPGVTLGPSTALLDGVDVRAAESYLILPPSETAGGAYRWKNDVEPEPLPDYVLDLIRQQAVDDRGLPGDGEEIPEGQRNDKLFNVALRLWRAGMTFPVVRAAVYAHAETYAQGTMTTRELDDIVHSARRFAEKHPHDEPEDDLGDEPLIARLHGLDTQHLVEQTPPIIEWVWDDYMAPGTLNMLHGDGGLGKSYLSLKIAEQMLRPEGGELFGKKIRPGGVVILDGENAEVQIHHRIHNTTIVATAPLKVFSVDQPILGYEEKTNALFAWIAAEYDPRLVIIDSQRALWAGDEKEQMEVGRMLRAFAKGLEAFPYATLLLHHDNRGKDYAGSSDMNAAISGARLHLEKHGTKDETQARRLSMPKNRIGPEMLPQEFFLSIETQPRSHRYQVSGIGIRSYESSTETMAAGLVEQAKTKILNQTCTSEELWAAFGWEIKNHEPQKREQRDVWKIIKAHLEDAGYVHGRVAGHGNRNLWRAPGVFHDLT